MSAIRGGVVRGILQRAKGWAGKPVATPETDPEIYLAHLHHLPNPDPILRHMGRAEEVYAAIMADAHVMGELRSVRGSFRSHQYRVVAGNEQDAKSQAAAELCTQWMAARRPNDLADWMEIMWQMCAAIFTGYRAHEVIFDYVDGHWLPVSVLDRPNRRFVFDAQGKPLLISKGSLQGAPVPERQFVISRHMPTASNPYGIALLSSCFWPWTFKTGGYKYFVQYCERHGLPWPVGRYPTGTQDKDIDALGDALAAMLQSGYAVVPDGTGVEILVPTSSGSHLPQERLILLCNREMSKAITSQAMVGEQLTVGAKAAADTALERQNAVHDSDRDIAAAGMSQIFEWITFYNFGPDVAPPRLDFFKKQVAGKERAETYQIAANMGAHPSRAAMLEELDIPLAETDADALLPQQHSPANPQQSAPATFAARAQARAGFTFAKAAGITEAEAIQLAADAADQIVADTLIAPVYEMLSEYEQAGKTLEQFRADFARLVGEVDDEALREVLERCLQYGVLRGLATQAD